MGVCDGHGENGHYVSEYLINHLPQDFNETYNDLKQKEQKVKIIYFLKILLNIKII